MSTTGPLTMKSLAVDLSDIRYVLQQTRERIENQEAWAKSRFEDQERRTEEQAAKIEWLEGQWDRRQDRLNLLSEKIDRTIRLSEEIDRAIRESKATHGQLQQIVEMVGLQEDLLMGVTEERCKDHNMLLGLRDVVQGVVNKTGADRSRLDYLEGLTKSGLEQAGKEFGRIDENLDSLFQRVYRVSWRDRLWLWWHGLRNRGENDGED